MAPTPQCAVCMAGLLCALPLGDQPTGEGDD